LSRVPIYFSYLKPITKPTFSMADTLETLFGSPLRLKIIKLFVFNADKQFDMDAIALRMNAKPRAIGEEIAYAKKLGLAKQSTISKMVQVKKGKKVVEKKKKVPAWSLDLKFKLIEPLADFLVRTQSLEHRAIVRRLEKAGKVKVVIVSGIFMRDAESRLDLFVIGDNIKTQAIDRVVKGIEADMGKDIRYVVLSVPDFSYRKSMNDKLVRDVMDYPHTVLVDKIGISNA
jgi:hypothetical protein